jgi:hypothetical protein
VGSIHTTFLLGESNPAYAQTSKESKLPGKKPLAQSLTGAVKADFDAAKLLANDGDFASALIKFQSAYDNSKDPRLLWNVAFCQKNLRHYAKVLVTLKRYVDEGGTVLTANDKKEAQDLMALIEPFTTRANFRVNEEGAAISVDDELLGTSPLPAPALLDIGERHIRVIKDGFRSYEKTLPVGGNNEVNVDVTLEKEVHEGKLIVNAPANAAIFVDDKPVATQKLDLTLLSGGHQIRVTAAGMHPFQTEVVIKDRETRSLEVALEPLAPAEKPKLRVAVGCSDTEPKAPEEGLIVYLDGPDVLAPTLVKRQWNDDQKRNVVQEVEYAISPGAHRVRVAITDCRPIDVNVNVDTRAGAKIEGALESDRFVLVRGPLGSPGWLRLALGLWMPGGTVQDKVPETYSGNVSNVVGTAIEAGLVSRWFGVYLSGTYGKGSFRRETFNSNYALPDKANVTWDQFTLRLGPRFPFHSVALGFGVSLGVQERDLDQVRTGHKSGVAGAFGQLDVQPLCDWGLFALGQAEKPFNDDRVFGAMQVGIYFQPNAKCRKERSTKVGLHTNVP